MVSQDSHTESDIMFIIVGVYGTDSYFSRGVSRAAVDCLSLRGSIPVMEPFIPIRPYPDP